MSRPAQRRVIGRIGLIYGGSSLAANLLGYAYLAVLARSLTPAEYGAAGALLGAGIISGILSVALQLVVARQVSSGEGQSQASGNFALALAGATTVVALACVPMAVHYLHLHSAWPAIWVALTLLPITLAGAFLGHLLGSERFVRLAVATFAMASARLASGLLGAVLGWGLTGALAALAVATLAAVLLQAVLAAAPRWWRPREQQGRRHLTEVTTAAASVAAFLLLTNMDALLARHYLTADMSGIYVLGSLFAKAGLWGPQFVAVVVFPRLSAGGDHGSLYRRAAAATTGLGLLIAGLSAVFAKSLVTHVSGDEYLPATRYAVAFALLGTMFSLVHLAMVSNVALGGRLYGRLLWAGAAVEATAVSLWLHGSIGNVLWGAAAVAGVLAATGWVIVVRHESIAGATPSAHVAT